jgi:hypothetical protein
MASRLPILLYAAVKADSTLRWLFCLMLAELALVLAGAGVGIGGDVYDRLHPMSWRGATVTTPIYNATFAAACLLWLLILPLFIAAFVRHRRRAK